MILLPSCISKNRSLYNLLIVWSRELALQCAYFDLDIGLQITTVDIMKIRALLRSAHGLCNNKDVSRRDPSIDEEQKKVKAKSFHTR